MKLLRNGKDPKNIITDIFHIRYRGPKQLDRTLSTLFSEEGHDLESLIRTFSINAPYYLKIYKP